MSLYTRDLDKELPTMTRVFAGLTLALFGFFASILWFVTGDKIVGIFGAAMGLPCTLVGTGLVIGNKSQTKLSANGLKILSFILIVVGGIGLYQGYPYSSISWAFAGACVKTAKNKKDSTW